MNATMTITCGINRILYNVVLLPFLFGSCSRTVFAQTPYINRLDRCEKDNIQTESQLRFALEHASEDMAGPPTIIEVCTHYIAVTASYDVSTPSNINNIIDNIIDNNNDDDNNTAMVGDRFALNIKNKNINLRCNMKPHCTIEAINGTGIFYVNNSTLNMHGFNFTNGGNRNHTCGGAVYLYDSTLTVTDSVFSTNTAQKGAAICSDVPTSMKSLSRENDSSSSSSRNTVERKQDQVPNKIVLNGVGYSNDQPNSIYTIDRVDFIKNSAQYGGAMYVSNIWMDASNVRFLDNEAERYGGAIHFDNNCTVQMSNSIFDTNYASDTGGAVSTSNVGFVLFTNTTFHHNVVQIHSPAIYVSKQYKVELVNTEIVENTVGATRQSIIFSDTNVQDTLETLGTLNESPPSVKSTTIKIRGTVPSNVSGKKCFEDGDELRTAVTMYITGGIRSRGSVKAKYGTTIGSWCVGKVTDFSSVFDHARDFNEDLSLWDVSSATAMNGMFWGATSFNQEIGSWDVSKVTTMRSMFWGATTFNQDLSKWDVSNVKEMPFMFSGATSFNQDLSSWDVSNVVDMSYMFYSATSFHQDLGTWNVISVTDMAGMFAGASSFNYDLGSWNVSQVTTMGSMFKGAYSFNQDLGSWDVSKVTDMPYMFSGATTFNQDLSSWDVSIVSSMYRMYSDAKAFQQNLCLWKDKVNAGTDVSEMFIATSCPNDTDPIQSNGGHFCYACE